MRGLWVGLDAPLAAPSVAHFTLADIPEKPIDLTIPPTGRVVIDVADSSGRPIESPGMIDVRGRFDFEKDLPAIPAGKRWPAVRWFADDRRAHYELPCVEVGLRLVVESEKEGRDPVKTVVDGPTKPGETVSIRLVVPPAPEKKRLRGRILDEAGAPVAGATVELVWNRDATRVCRSVIARGTSADDGRLEADLDRYAEAKFEEEIEPWLEAIIPRPDGDGVLASGMVALPRTKEISGLDFSEIRVHPSPPFASGIVVDDAGSPVAGAQLRVTVLPKNEGNLSGDFTDPILSATTKADGRFTVWGDAPDGENMIAAEPGEEDRPVPLTYSSEFLNLESGSKDLRFVLWRCGTIVAHVVGGGEDGGHLSYSSTTVRTDGRRVDGETGGVEDDGTVETEVPIGHARLEISSGRTVVATRDNIEVKPGAVIELDPIDVSAPAHQVELTIVDESGAPVPAGWVVMPDAEDEKRIAGMKKLFGPERAGVFPFPRQPNVTTFKDGKLTLRSEAPLPPFAVGAAGLAAVVLRHPAAAERVVLEPAPRVALVLEHDGDSVPEPLQFFVRVSPTNDDDEWFRFGPTSMAGADTLRLPKLDGITLERGRPVDLPLRCLGKTRLDLILGEKSPGGYGGAMIEVAPHEFEVARSRDPQVFHVKVERAAIDAVLAEQVKRRNEKKSDR